MDESIQHDFEQKVVAIAKRWKVGDPKDAETTMGPLVSQVQRDIVSKQVDAAVKEGAKVLYQSECPTQGYFFPVTVLSSLKQDMSIQKHETFGPVIALSTFDATKAWLRARGNSIEGGTSEVQLNIIAKRVLGLPD